MEIVSRPCANLQQRRDNLGKELRVLEHARRVAAVARGGRRRRRVAALELEHRTEHRRKGKEGLRELHRWSKLAKTRAVASSRGAREMPGANAASDSS